MPFEVKASTNPIWPSGAAKSACSALVAMLTRYRVAVGAEPDCCDRRLRTYERWSGETACIVTGSHCLALARNVRSLSFVGVNVPAGRSTKPPVPFWLSWPSAPMLLSGWPFGAEITKPATGRRQLSAPEAAAAEGVAPAGEWLAVGVGVAPHALASMV